MTSDDATEAPETDRAGGKRKRRKKNAAAIYKAEREATKIAALPGNGAR